MQTSDEFGIFTNEISFDYGKMQKYKERSVDTYRQEICRMFRGKKDYGCAGEGNSAPGSNS